MSKTLSQITTALESDKTAIRQAILSGGGTCPSSHGFDEFASDIGSIPVSDTDSIALALYRAGISDSVLTDIDDMTNAIYNMISWNYSYLGFANNSFYVSLPVPSSSSSYGTITPLQYLPLYYYVDSTRYRNITAESPSKINMPVTIKLIKDLNLLPSFSYLGLNFKTQSYSGYSTYVDIGYKIVAMQDDAETTNPSDYIDLSQLTTLSVSTTVTNSYHYTRKEISPTLITDPRTLSSEYDNYYLGMAFRKEYFNNDEYGSYLSVGIAYRYGSSDSIHYPSKLVVQSS